jgi:phenylpropionate dioxygenase-like ring-hydroxylating dioxygenase large terminal subunit
VQSLALRKVAVETLGPLVFARLAGEEKPLATAFGFLAPQISAMAAAAGELIGSIEIEIAANWKLVVENTLEGYHLAWVHEQTFGRLKMAYPKFEVQGNHALSYARVSEEALRSFARVNSLFQDRPITTEGYVHSVVFPNFGVASLYGMTFAFQRFVPAGPELTKLRIDVFGTRLKREVGARDRALLNQLFTSALEFSRKVCAEDQAIVELQQLGVRARQQTGILSDEEVRIAAFQREYVRFMQDRSPANPSA